MFWRFFRVASGGLWFAGPGALAGAEDAADPRFQPTDRTLRAGRTTGAPGPSQPPDPLLVGILPRFSKPAATAPASSAPSTRTGPTEPHPRRDRNARPHSTSDTPPATAPARCPCLVKRLRPERDRLFRCRAGRPGRFRNNGPATSCGRVSQTQQQFQHPPRPDCSLLPGPTHKPACPVFDPEASDRGELACPELVEGARGRGGRGACPNGVRVVCLWVLLFLPRVPPPPGCHLQASSACGCSCSLRPFRPLPGATYKPRLLVGVLLLSDRSGKPGHRPRPPKLRRVPPTSGAQRSLWVSFGQGRGPIG